jgi:hypothetical protein
MSDDAIQDLITDYQAVAAGGAPSHYTPIRAQEQHSATLATVAELRSALEGRAAEVAELQARFTRLAWGVVANAGRLSTTKAPRWVRVKNATGLGSTSSKELCRSAGFDPDEVVGLDQVDEEGP